MSGPPQRNETPAEKLDRNWNELLQELRVAQTGTQILFAFLLSIAFTATFQRADTFTHRVFAATLVLCALATGLLVGPVAFHRIVFRRGLKGPLVEIASRMAAAGVFLLLWAMAGGLLVALDTVLARPVALGLSSGVVAWCLLLWYAVPARTRHHDEG